MRQLFIDLSKYVGRRSCSLPEIASLARGVHATLGDVPGMLCSSAPPAVFQDMHMRLARLIIKDLSGSFAPLLQLFLGEIKSGAPRSVISRGFQTDY
jgi:hypothetical protein